MQPPPRSYPSQPGNYSQPPQPGQGAPPQQFGQPPSNPGQYPPQNQGQYPPQNQGQYPPQNQGQYPPQNQGQYPPQMPPQNQGQYPPQGQGQYPNQGQQYPPSGAAQQQPGPPPNWNQAPPAQQGGMPPQAYSAGPPPAAPPPVNNAQGFAGAPPPQNAGSQPHATPPPTSYGQPPPAGGGYPPSGSQGPPGGGPPPMYNPQAPPTQAGGGAKPIQMFNPQALGAQAPGPAAGAPPQQQPPPSSAQGIPLPARPQQQPPPPQPQQQPPPPQQQQQPQQQQPPPAAGGYGQPPPAGAGYGQPPPPQQQNWGVPSAFADPEDFGNSSHGQSQPPPAGGYQQGGPPPPGGGGFAPPRGGMPPPPGGSSGPTPSAAPPAPVQFFNPAALPNRAKGQASAAPTEQMGGLSVHSKGGGAPVRILGDAPPPPPVWNEPSPFFLPPDGQSHPRYMHCTTNAIPASAAAAQKYALPIAVVVHPLNDPPPPPDAAAAAAAAGQPPPAAVPVVNFGACGVIRCRRCRTYVNPFVAFIDGGRRWRCNVCGLLNDVPSEYYCALDAAGRRRDHAERPELNCGTVEYIAPADYMVRPPQPPCFLFVIDVSTRSVQSGLLREVCATIEANLDRLPGGSRTRIGFLTFDSSLHYYNLKSSLQEPQMLAVADLDEPFLPLPNDLLVNLQESKEVVKSLLSKLPQAFTNTVIADTALAPAIQSASAMMQYIGGKIIIFQSVLPSLTGKTATPSAVRPREDTKLLGTERESILLNPSTDFFKTLALEACSKNQISVDIFSCCEHFADLANLVPLCRYTNGQLWHYPNFDAARDADSFRSDLTRALTRQLGLEAVMRIRASAGIKVSAFHGNHYLRGADLLALPTVDCDKAFTCDLVHEDQAITCSHVCIQCALLYTTTEGERRIRVCNLNLPVTNNLGDLYTTIDARATMNVLLKTAVEQAQVTRITDARSRIQTACVSALRAHRIMFGTALPEQALLLPLYTLAALKNAAIRDGVDVRADERSALMMQVGSMSTGQTSVLLVPSIFALHKLAESDGGAVVDGVVKMPPCGRLTAEALEGHGVYLADNGLCLLMWIGKNVSPQLLIDLLNLPSADRLDGAKVQLPVLQTDLSIRVNNIVRTIRSERPTAMPLYTVRQGGAAEGRFGTLLIEDRNLTTMSYTEWWQALGRQLQ